MSKQPKRSFFRNAPTAIKLLLSLSITWLPLAIGMLYTALQSHSDKPQWAIILALSMMWTLSIVITFMVINRLLLRPLRALQHMVHTHRPGDQFQMVHSQAVLPEVQSLNDAITGYINELDAKDASLATALDEQRRATREVHHRVKNNIQVVASLINLHARAAKSPDTARAYAAIQRRVDAMAIVHRNHYAESSETQGLDMKVLLGEIMSNLRANFTSASPHITMAATPVRTSQDNALAVGFLATELAELAVAIDPAATIRFEVGRREQTGYFGVESSAFANMAALNAQLEQRYGRVIDGLARQLRTSLNRETQSFAVTFAVIDPH